MRKPRVYVETSVVSYLTARPARDIVLAGRQQSTRDWWAGAKERFELVISELVREEAAVGDRDAAQSRLAAISPLPVIGTTLEVGTTGASTGRRQGRSGAGCTGCRAHRDRRHAPCAVPRDLEFPAHRECRGAATDRGGLSRRRDRSAAPVHAGATCRSGGRR